MKHNLTKEYDNLVDIFEHLGNEIAKVQREKDLKVDTINKKYEIKIGNLSRKQNLYRDLIATYKKHTRED